MKKIDSLVIISLVFLFSGCGSTYPGVPLDKSEYNKYPTKVKIVTIENKSNNLEKVKEKYNLNIKQKSNFKKSNIVIANKYFESAGIYGVKSVKYYIKERKDRSILWKDIKSKSVSQKEPKHLEMQLLNKIQRYDDQKFSDKEIITAIEDLISRIDDLNYIYDNIHRSPLGYALSKKRYELAEFLIKKGASINLVDSNFGKIEDVPYSNGLVGTTNFYQYEEKGNSLVKKVFDDIENKDIVDTIKHFHYLGLSEYVFNESSILNLVIEKNLSFEELEPIINTINNLYPTSINYVSPSINNLSLDQLTTNGNNWQFFHSNTMKKLPAIQYASYMYKEYEKNSNDFFKLIDYLISLGGKVDSNPGYNLTPFAIACINKMQAQKCGYFLDKNVNLNIKSVLNQKDNALIRYISYFRKTPSEHKNYFKTLINKNIEINSVNINNDSALSIAIQKKKFFEVNLLIKKGADVTIMNNDGYNALDFAEKINHKKIIELVRSSPSGKQLKANLPSSTIIYKDRIVNIGNKSNSLEKVKEEYNLNIKQKYDFKKSNITNHDSFALVIGINDYKQNTSVEFADLSALAFQDLATQTFGVPKENVITLLNDEATSGQLKSKIELIKELADSNGNLYIYFAGHGVPGKDGNTYVLPNDMSADSIHLEPNLQLNKIYSKLSKSNAKNVFVFMDSCFSGKDDKGELLYKGVAPILKRNKENSINQKLTIITAGGANDFANDYKDEQQRLFSHYLIKELAQGEINLEKVYATIKNKVKRTSLMKGIGYKQVPEIHGNKQISLY